MGHVELDENEPARELKRWDKQNLSSSLCGDGNVDISMLIVCRERHEKPEVARTSWNVHGERPV